ncbi:MAG TPA: M4 family metallopeptidase [Blastocatellia bacterium]|nr:M4 family metallopeptidase [Blastocatellia bacterium]
MKKNSSAKRAAHIIRRRLTVIPRPAFYLLATVFVLAVISAQLSSSLTAAQSGKAATPQQPQAGPARRALEPTARAAAALDTLRRAAGNRVATQLAAQTGNYSFVRATDGAVLAADNTAASPEDRALAFLSAHGGVVGINDDERARLAGRSVAGKAGTSAPAASELRAARVESDEVSGTHVRLNQFYLGMPVFGAQVIVHMNKRGITAVNGHFVPDIRTGGAPRITPAEAAEIALRFRVGPNPLRVVRVDLSIYRAGLLEGYQGDSLLAYSVEVTDGKRLREQIWIDAQKGGLIIRIPLNHTAMHRTIYSPDYDPENPDLFVVRREGEPPYPGPPPELGGHPFNNLYDFAAHTYNLYRSAFGRDAYDGAGHPMASVYLVNDQCPNAYWNGIATNYCPDLDADDVVSHEWSHAYTQFTHGLIYAYQSGGLNESYSDIFGETVDLLNGVDGEGGSNNAEPLPNGQRWQVGDDVPSLNQEALGILRDMWDPTRYGQPDKSSSPNYGCAADDVHNTSGVPNHAYAMLVDGKTFNGQTVQAIGFTKAAHIYWRAASVYQTPTTDFANHAQSLLAAADDLIQAGTNLNALSTSSTASVPSGQVVTAFDRQQVEKAILAVELNQPSPCPIVILLDPAPAEICQGSGTIFSEDWETGMDGWTTTSTGVNIEWDNRTWVVDASLPAGRAGSAAYARNPALGEPGGGTCQPGGDYSGQFTIDGPTITVPAGASSLRLSFDHYVASEATFDGGQLEVSVNGGSFALVAQGSYLHNPPNSQFEAAPPIGLNTNPNAGEFAWNGTNIGTPTGSPPGSWGTTLVDLSALASPGSTIKLRFNFSQDGCNGVDGWYVDNIRLFACPTLDGPTLTVAADYENPDTNGSYTLNWTRPAGAVGPDVLQESATSCAPLLSDNAEGGLGQWTVASAGGPAPLQPTWTNAPANAKPNHASATFWAHGTEESVSTFTTLTYNLPVQIPTGGVTTLSFSDWYFNEDDDKAAVEVSTDGGASWTAVYTVERGMGALPDVGVDAFANEQLTRRQIDLTIYSGKSIRLRFRYDLGGDDFIFFVQYGWYVDDISIKSDNWTDVATTTGTSFTVSGRGAGTRCYRVRTTYLINSQQIPSLYSNLATVNVANDCGLVELTPSSAFFTSQGREGALKVLSPGNCAYSAATSSASWIEIVSPGGASGNTEVSFVVRDNLTGSGRQGTITAGGKPFVVTQDGGQGGCQYSISPTFTTVAAGGGGGTVSVTCQSGCAWQSSTSASWIVVTSNCCGVGNGSVTYSVEVNRTGSSRSGTVTVGGKTLAIKQPAN